MMADSFGFYSVAFIDAHKHRFYEYLSRKSRSCYSHSLIPRMRQEVVAEPSPKVSGSRKRSEPDKEPEKKEVRVDGTVSAPSLASALALPWSDPQLQAVPPQFFGLQRTLLRSAVEC